MTADNGFLGVIDMRDPDPDRIGSTIEGDGTPLDAAHIAKLEGRSRGKSVLRMESLLAESEAASSPEQPAAVGSDGQPQKPSLADQIKPTPGTDEQWWQAALRNVSPPEAMGGALDFADNAFETIRQISAKGDQALMDMGIPALTSEGFTTDYEKFAKTKNVGDYLPDIGDPEKMGIARGIGRFVAGYALAGRALSGVKTLQTISQSGRFGQSAVAALKGAMSDFAGMREMEGNLANLVESFPAIANPVSDLLSAKDESPELVNKLKTAMVGAGFGMALDGVMSGLRAVRAGRQVQQVTGEMDQIAAGMVNEAETARGMITDALGNPDDARLVIEAGETIAEGAAKGADEAAGAAFGGATNPNPNAGLRVGNVYVNLARIDSEDDVKTVIQDLANRYSDSIDAGRGPVETFEQTAEFAAREDAWKILQERAAGTPLNARQSLAVRQLWTASGSAVKEQALRVSAGGSAADKIALKKMIAIHATIQEQVIGARTETARALAQWRIPAGESDQFLSGVGKLMDQMGNDGDINRIARGINELSALGREDSVDRFLLGASKLDEMKKYGEQGADMVRQLFYFSLLSGPKTHVRNGISNFAMLLANAADRKGAAILGDVLGGQNVPDGEAVAMLHGQVNGIMDAFRISDYAREVAELEGRTAHSPVVNALLTGEQGMGLGARELPRVGAFDPEKLGFDPTGNVGRVLDFIDTATSSTGRALAASDEVFRTAQYNGEMHALAYRRAWQEAESGMIAREAITDRAAEIANNPDIALRLLSQRFAEKSIFANAPPADSKMFKMMKGVSNFPILGKLTLPFTKTPYNIFMETASRTPVALITKPFWTEIKAGGARADIAWTKFLTGNAALLALADMAVKGNVLGAQRGIGSENSQGEVENLRRMGNQPMSIKSESADGGVTSVGFRGMEPFSTLIGMAGNIVEILSSDQFDAEDKDVADVVTAASAAIAMQVTSPSFMQGITSMVSFMDDPNRYGETFFERNASVVVPNGLAEVARTMDPTIREVDGMIQAIMAKTPGLSDKLEPNTDRWGADLTRESGIGWAYDAASPFPVVKTKPAPIDRELARLDLGLAKPQKKQYFDGLPVNMKLHPKEYTRLVKLAGNEMTETIYGDPIRTGAYESEGGGLKDELSAIVEGRHSFSDIYMEGTDGPDGSKADYIQDIVQAFRDEAKFHVVMESPALRAKLGMRYEKRLEGAGDPDQVAPNKFLEITE